MSLGKILREICEYAQNKASQKVYYTKHKEIFVNTKGEVIERFLGPKHCFFFVFIMKMIKDQNIVQAMPLDMKQYDSRTFFRVDTFYAAIDAITTELQDLSKIMVRLERHILALLLPRDIFKGFDLQKIKKAFQKKKDRQMQLPHYSCFCCTQIDILIHLIILGSEIDGWNTTDYNTLWLYKKDKFWAMYDYFLSMRKPHQLAARQATDYFIIIFIADCIASKKYRKCWIKKICRKYISKLLINYSLHKFANFLVKALEKEERERSEEVELDNFILSSFLMIVWTRSKIYPLLLFQKLYFIWHIKEPSSHLGGILMGIDLDIYDIGAIYEEGDFYLIASNGLYRKEAFLTELVQMDKNKDNFEKPDRILVATEWDNKYPLSTINLMNMLREEEMKCLGFINY
ncbi:hypothetical protein ACJX0J_022248, partial [Zea mays]